MVWVLAAKHWVAKASCLWVLMASHWVEDAMVRPRGGKAIAVRAQSSWVQYATDAASPTQWIDVDEANHLRLRPNGYLDGALWICISSPKRAVSGGSGIQIESIAVMGNP